MTNLRGVSIPLKKCANLALSCWISWHNVAGRDSQSFFAVIATACQPRVAKLACFVEQKMSHARTPS